MNHIKWKWKLFSRIRLFATPWTVTRQASLFVGLLQAKILEWFGRSPPGGLPKPGMEPRSPALQVDSLPSEPPGNVIWSWVYINPVFLIYSSPFPFGSHRFVFYVCESVSVLYISSFVSFCLDSMYKWCHVFFVWLSLIISRSSEKNLDTHTHTQNHCYSPDTIL